MDAPQRGQCQREELSECTSGVLVSCCVEELEASGTSTEVVGLAPDLPLAEAFAGVILGDWVSYHLAMALEVDPTPVEAINRYKARLAAG